jgi:hypothetical protein
MSTSLHHAVTTGDASPLARLQELVRPSNTASMLRFLAEVVQLQVGKTATLAKICEGAAPRYRSDQLDSQFLLAAKCFAALPPARRQAISLHPAFNYWLNGMQRLVLSHEFEKAAEWSQQLADFIWAEDQAGLLMGRTWCSRLDDRGGLRCPAARAFIEFGQRCAGLPVAITPEPAQIRIEVENQGAVYLPRERLRSHGWSSGSAVRVALLPLIACDQIECSARDAGLRVVWRDIMNRTKAIDFFGTTMATYPENPALGPYVGAMDKVMRVWPELGMELPLMTRVLVPTDSGAEQRRAATLPSRNGAIYVDLDDPSLMEEALVHEHAHIKLRYFQYFDPLMREFENETLRVQVPWRPDPRPLPGIFEGVFVYSHVAEYALRRSLAEKGEPESRALLLADWARQGMDILAQHSQFSPNGVELLDRLASWNVELRRMAAH